MGTGISQLPRLPRCVTALQLMAVFRRRKSACRFILNVDHVRNIESLPTRLLVESMESWKAWT